MRGAHPSPTLETTQRQIDGFFSQLPFKCYLPEEASVGCGLRICLWVASRVAYTIHHTPCTLHPSPYTLHPTPYTLRPTSCTLHPTPHTPYHTPHTLHLSPCIPHPTPSTLNPQIRQRTDTGGVSCPAPHSGSKSPFSISLMFPGCRQIPTTCSTNQGPWTDDLLLHTLNPQWSKQAAD